MTLKAKKSLGQNFLIDRNILELITNCTEIKNKSILEVGPGTGNLTQEIIKKNPKEIFLIEKDTNLLNLLKDKFKDKAIYYNQDILNFSEEKLSIININTEFWFDKLILMFQKEVADRIISENDGSNYGRLSIISNWKLKIEKITDIKPNSFKPKPKVDSSLLIFTPKENFIKLDNPKNLEKVTRVFFNQRRKKIKKPLSQLFKNYDKIAKKLNLNLDLRPQNLSFDTYYLLTKELENL